MRFWDTSGILPLFVEERASQAARRLFADDPTVTVWWGTPVECSSATARLRREGVLSTADEAETLRLIARLQQVWVEVQPSEELRSVAQRLLRVHSLRGSDALQLAAALTWAGGAETAALVTLDERLALAARLEGFRVLP